MSELTAISEAALDVVAPDNSTRRVDLKDSPFLLGRGEAGNHLALSDMRISRQCAAIVHSDGEYFLEDRGHRSGLFVNREKVSRQALRDGDVITFGVENSFRVIFRSQSGADAEAEDSESFQTLLSRMEQRDATDASSGGLGKLNLLLEATRLMHSRLPLEAVLEAMLDRAISVTDADRALLLEADASGSLHRKLARRNGAASLPIEEFSPSQTVISLAVKQGSSVIAEDLNRADEMLQDAQSIVSQRLQVVIAIPLYNVARAVADESSAQLNRGRFLGVLYLDSKRPTAFSKLDRQILDAIAIESASILDNARLVKSQRERERMDRELDIARTIQQGLLPKGFREFPYLTIGGTNSACHAVGGDYFDIFPIDERRTAFLIADVSGKGLGAALVTTMLQGTFAGIGMGADPAMVFRHINQFLCDHVEVNRHATLFFAILDCDGNLDYLNAGHPSPFLVRRGVPSELYRTGSLPLGLLPDAEHTPERAKLEPGDTLVLYSDGVTEAMGANEDFFGEDRFKAILAEAHSAPLDQLQQRIFSSVMDFAVGAEQDDDITILLLRFRPAKI